MQDALAASFKASSPDEVEALTQQLLASLGDPYTRLLLTGSGDAAAFAAEAEGKVHGWLGAYVHGLVLVMVVVYAYTHCMYCAMSASSSKNWRQHLRAPGCSSMCAFCMLITMIPLLITPTPQ
jgi:hypothetical protein